MNHHMIKVCAATPKLVVADIKYNTKQILTCLQEAHTQKSEIIVFPELAMTGSTCGDLFYQQSLLKAVLAGLKEVIEYSKTTTMLICLGMPLALNHHIFNCAVMVQEGEILGVVPKAYLSNYSHEKRWFADPKDARSSHVSLNGQKVPFSSQMIFKANNHDYLCIGVQIGEGFRIDDSLAGANVILNLAANSEIAGSQDRRRLMLRALSARTNSAYVYASAGCGESSTDGVYSGHNLICENGELINESQRFSQDNSLLYGILDPEQLVAIGRKDNPSQPMLNEDYTIVSFMHTERNYQFDRFIDPYPFVPEEGPARDSHCLDVFTLQSVGLAKRLDHVGLKHVVLGISGGLDSTLALIVCVKAFKRLGLDLSGIVGVTMPGFGTTDRTYDNAMSLMKNLGVTIREISIVPATLQHFKDIGHDPDLHDITYENTQARERTQILMDIANQVGGLVIGTGDLSELALGWATYNGDHMSMYAVNAGVPKTLVKFLIQWAANNEFTGATSNILMDVFATPVSPELLPPSTDGDIEQKTEEIVGPYELHDFYLYHVVNHGFSPKKIVILAQNAFANQYDYEVIVKWIKIFYRRFVTQQFKRSCLPDGPKVVSVSFSPRGEWIMPSDASYNLWLSEIESL